MNKYARFNIAACVDMQITSTARNAAANEFTIILEVEREEWLSLAHFADMIVKQNAPSGSGIRLVGESTPTGI